MELPHVIGAGFTLLKKDATKEKSIEIMQSLHAAASLFSFHEESEFIAVFAVTNEGIAGLAGECLEIPYGTRIGGKHAQNFTAGHFGQRFLGFQNRQRTVQTASVELFVIFHDQCSISGGIGWDREILP